MTDLNYEQLKDAVAGGAVAIRAVTRLMPAGGPGDKVFPPTFTKEGRAETKYAFESRRVDGAEVRTVLLDSVASQANRIEEALLEGYRRRELAFPIVEVDFSNSEGLEDLEQISSLQAPHRIADALLRDSMLGGTLFRSSDVGKAITDSRANHATAMFRYCPTALVFGVWDSTGPKGGMGAKFQRCLVSEIVGINAVPGVKVGSRIDPAAIEKSAGPVYAHTDPVEAWTHDESLAKKEKGKPVLFGRKGDKLGSPAGINHGNIPPSIDAESGGVTIDYALQTTVLSLAGLRRLRFSHGTDDKPLAADAKLAAEDAARTALAALALAGVVFQRDNGFDLRSRSLLVPEGPLQLELVARDGGAPKPLSLDRAAAAKLLKHAAAEAAKCGLAWNDEAITLAPAPKLEHIIRVSREKRIGGEAEGDG